MLHDLGQIAYFADILDLATKIILKPEWLDDRITQVIDSQAVTAAGGVLSRAERGRLWGDLADAEDDPVRPASPPGSSPASTAIPPGCTGGTASFSMTATPALPPGRC
jgi:C-terminal of Roc, COR, domain